MTLKTGVPLNSLFRPKLSDFEAKPIAELKVTAHSNNRNSKSSREVILGSVRL